MIFLLKKAFPLLIGPRGTRRTQEPRCYAAGSLSFVDSRTLASVTAHYYVIVKLLISYKLANIRGEVELR